MKNASKKNRILSVFAGILAAAALTSAVIPVSAGSCCTVSADALSEQQIIEEIITNYGKNGEQASGTVDTLLDALQGMNSKQGELWTDIMHYWTYVNQELTVNTETLPADLPHDNTMALTVLGYKLNDDGTMHDELIERLKVTLACAEQYPNAYVICTGGGTARNCPEVTEGSMMGEGLLAHGLDESRLIIEDQSRNTAENAVFSYEILQKDFPQVDSIVLISSDYHIARASLLFEAAIMKSASDNQTPEMHVISNCACCVENTIYQQSDPLRLEAVGMLQMIGSNELAMQFMFGNRNNPPRANESQ